MGHFIYDFGVPNQYNVIVSKFQLYIGFNAIYYKNINLYINQFSFDIKLKKKHFIELEN